MSTKKKWRHTGNVGNTGDRYLYHRERVVFYGSINKEDCETICNSLNALDAAREALKGYAQCSDGCTCGDGWSHEAAIEALKLLNPKVDVK